MSGRWRHLLAPDLAVLFVGFNPSPHSWEAGHFYAYPGNAFWRLLAEGGLAPPGVGPADDARLLALGMGFMDLCDRPTVSADLLGRRELEAGRRRLAAVVAALTPRWVAFTGKGVYGWAAGRRSAGVAYGEAPSPFPPPTRVFVLPSPSGRSGLPYRQKLAAYASLAAELGRAAGGAVRPEEGAPCPTSPR